MSFPQTTPMRPVPGAFLNTPAMTARFQAGQDPVRRQLWPVNENSQVASTGRDDAAGALQMQSANAAQSQTPAAAQGDSSAFASTSLVPVVNTENAPPVVRAAKAINTFLQQDDSFPSLESYSRREFKAR